MYNPVEELSRHLLEINKEILCLSIAIDIIDEVVEDSIKIDLPIGYSKEDYQKAMERLGLIVNLHSDDITGTIWFTDMTWSERESKNLYSSIHNRRRPPYVWVNKVMPEIPLNLWKKTNNESKN